MTDIKPASDAVVKEVGDALFVMDGSGYHIYDTIVLSLIARIEADGKVIAELRELCGLALYTIDSTFDVRHKLARNEDVVLYDKLTGELRASRSSTDWIKRLGISSGTTGFVQVKTLGRSTK
jgi:hypothetical protein